MVARRPVNILREGITFLLRFELVEAAEIVESAEINGGNVRAGGDRDRLLRISAALGHGNGRR